MDRRLEQLLQASAVISDELDRQERIARRPDYEITIGRVPIRIKAGKPLKDYEIKTLVASQQITQHLLDAVNPFGSFREFDDSQKLRPTRDGA